MWECVLIVWNNGGRNIKLDEPEFNDIPLSGDSMFNMEICTDTNSQQFIE